METPVTDTTKLRELLAHCDGKDCKCMAYGPHECACPADWTPAEVYILRDRADALEAGIRELVAKWRGPSQYTLGCRAGLVMAANELAALLPADGEG